VRRQEVSPIGCLRQYSHLQNVRLVRSPRSRSVCNCGFWRKCPHCSHLYESSTRFIVPLQAGHPSVLWAACSV